MSISRKINRERLKVLAQKVVRTCIDENDDIDLELNQSFRLSWLKRRKIDSFLTPDLLIDLLSIIQYHEIVM